MSARPPPLALFIDVASIGAVSLAICTVSDRIAVMSVVVAVAWLLRCIAWDRLDPQQRVWGWRTESWLLVALTVLGAFNDWNAVVRHGVYEYTVPAYWPEYSTIPVWMLLYWGLILRAVVSVLSWGGWPKRRPLRSRFVGGGATVAIGVLMLLVLCTRQAIYLWYDDPWLSWLPFAAALAAYVKLFSPGARQGLLALLLVTVGPAVEVAYIQVGHLHAYRLGWLAGVPVWIILWWALAGLVLDDIIGLGCRWRWSRAPSCL